MTTPLRALLLLALGVAAVPADAADAERRCRAAIATAMRRALENGLATVDRCHAAHTPGGCAAAAGSVRGKLGVLTRKCRGAAALAAFPHDDPVTALADAIVAEIAASEAALAGMAEQTGRAADRCRRAVDRGRRAIWLRIQRDVSPDIGREEWSEG